MDYYNNLDKAKKKLAGYREQEVLIELFAACIGGIVGMNEETLKLYLSQALQDALDKRKMTFKHIKGIAKEEKVKFINDLVLYTVKRAKLVNSVDLILKECLRTYDAWKRAYRPDEVNGD